MVFKHALFMKKGRARVVPSLPGRLFTNATGESRKRHGFTLIEVIVTMFILGILATILVAQLYDKDPEKELDRNARAVVNVLQLARSYTTSGYQCCTTGTVYGYGVRFYASNRYLIYADKDDSKRYNAVGAIPDEIIADHRLNTDDSFQAVNDIFFSLTEAAVYQVGIPLSSETTIILKYNTDPSITKTITISGITAAISYDE